MMQVLSSDTFWFGVIVGAVVLGWLAVAFVGHFYRNLLRCAHVGAPLRFSDGKYYCLVEVSQLEELKSYRKVMIRDMYNWTQDQLNQEQQGA